MSAHLTIVLTVAFVIIANARIVVGRSASMLPAEMMKNMEQEHLSNKVNIWSYFHWVHKHLHLNLNGSSIKFGI